MIGSEGCFGVLTHVTLKIFKYRPENHFYFGFMFKDWESAQKQREKSYNQKAENLRSLESPILKKRK